MPIINDSFLSEKSTREKCTALFINYALNDRNMVKIEVLQTTVVSRHFIWYVTTIRDSSFPQLQSLSESVRFDRNLRVQYF